MWHGLQAIHTLAFLCLLHSDEVLKIQVDHIKFVREVDGDIEYMVLTLPFHKTHQDGHTYAYLSLSPFIVLIVKESRCSANLYLPSGGGRGSLVCCSCHGTMDQSKPDNLWLPVSKIYCPGLPICSQGSSYGKSSI